MSAPVRVEAKWPILRITRGPEQAVEVNGEHEVLSLVEALCDAATRHMREDRARDRLLSLLGGDDDGGIWE